MLEQDSQTCRWYVILLSWHARVRYIESLNLTCGFAELSRLRLTNDEETWLKTTCPYLRPHYLSYLSLFQLDPKTQVEIEFIPDKQQKGEKEEWGDLNVKIEGKWVEVILYEVPIMAIISEVYFTSIDTSWNLKGQRALAKGKGHRLVLAGIGFSEFGTRRRRSYKVHRLVLEGLLEGEKEAKKNDSSGTNLGRLVGTSNVHFAHIFGLNPIGTVAHEWTMGIAALEGYAHPNLRSLQLWDAVYSPPNFIPDSPAHDLTIALTDTYSTEVFWKELLGEPSGKEILQRWRGLRQDSGDSKEFAKKSKQIYQDLGIDPKSKVIIYSDALDVAKCIELAQYSKELGIGASFGVGTHLTNDFMQTFEKKEVEDDLDDTSSLSMKGIPPSKALNMVIKLASVNGKKTVKISDELSKNTGDAEEIKRCKDHFGLPS